ncbi:MAG: Ldh family oxidoreductase [Bacteroidia bacterium]|nr:MAG: Ldh family oxidoreductase [Bacteroidia bacterium]
MYEIAELKSLAVSLLERCGVPAVDAGKTADVLVAAELRDIPSHGMLRLYDYIRMLQSGRINPVAKPFIVHESPSTLTLDGDNGLGPVVSELAMHYAIEKAHKAGTAWVAVRNSNHFGIAGYYAMQALSHNMIGLCMCNANPLVAPTFSALGMLGTNPLAVAIPARKEPPFVADFATAAIARGKVDLLQKQGLPIREGFVQNPDGSPSNDPGILTKGGAILPLGSTREYGSHKGYCMASVIDIFSALLSGANFGPFVPPSVDWLPVKDNLPGKGTGHFFGAMRINAFCPEDVFLEGMDHWITTMRNAKPAKGAERVIIPGDPEREAAEKNKNKGVPLKDKVKEQLRELCKELDVDCHYL